MAHEITIRNNGRAEMAYVGALPWHGLGQSVPEGCTVDEMRVAAGLEWFAHESTVQYATGHCDDETGSPILLPFMDKKVLFRSDTRAPLGVVGEKYNVVQPAAILEFFRTMTEDGGWHIHTAGSLNGGRRIWAMASNHTEGEAAPGDRVKGNLLLATSLDGTLKTVAAMTAVRVVCANTLKLALDTKRAKGGKLQDKPGDTVTTSHRSEFDPVAVKQSLGVARDEFAVFMEKAKAMAEMPIHVEEAREILRELFGQPIREKAPAEQTAAEINSSVQAAIANGANADFAALLARPMKGNAAGAIKREQKSVARSLALFSGEGLGADHAGSHGTRWGLFNAITQHIDHEGGRTPDARMSSAWFGKGHDKKTEALEMLVPAEFSELMAR